MKVKFLVTYVLIIHIYFVLDVDHYCPIGVDVQVLSGIARDAFPNGLESRIS